MAVDLAVPKEITVLVAVAMGVAVGLADVVMASAKLWQCHWLRQLLTPEPQHFSHRRSKYTKISGI